MDESAEEIALTEVVARDDVGLGCSGMLRRWLGERRPLVELAVEPVFVVVARVHGDDALEVAAAKSEKPIEARGGGCRSSVRRALSPWALAPAL